MSQFSQVLKTFRKIRRFSQLDLALEADVSARHISFLETGRAQPSRDMVDRLGDAMTLPLAERNQMMTQAGFAARYTNRAWNDDEMGPVRTAVTHILTSHAPYPAFVVDRLWTIKDMNGPAQMLLGTVGIATGVSLLDVLVNGQPDQWIENWPEVAHLSAKRLRVESAAAGGVPALDDAARQLAQVEGAAHIASGPVIPTIYKMGDLRLSLFSTITQFGTPEDLSLDDMRIEMFFPADTVTGDVLRSLGK